MKMLKFPLFILFAYVVIVAGFWMITRLTYSLSAQNNPMPFDLTYADRKKEEQSGTLASISIKVLNVDAAAELVTLDANNMMMVPTGEKNVGWYSKGARLGTKGSVVIAGHFNTKGGLPGVFYNLASLEKGDTIIAKDVNGKEFTYIVKEKEYFDWDKLMFLKIFGNEFRYRLNLITYDPQSSTLADKYRRVVVYTELK